MLSGVLLVRHAAEADELAGQVRASAARLQAWIPGTTKRPQLERGAVQVWSGDV